MPHDTPQSVFLKDYAPPAFLIDQVELHFELDQAATRVRSRLSIRRNPATVGQDVPLRLDGEGLELESVALDGDPLPPEDWGLDEAGLTVLGVPGRFTLETVVLIQPDRNTALEGLYRSGGLLCTQCEAEGFRKITYFIDRPDVMARYRVTLTGDKGRFPVLLANGNPVQQQDLPDGRHSAVWEDPFPKPSYLFAVVAGDLEFVEDRHLTPSGREVRLRIYVERHHLDQCAHAMASLKKAMVWDEAHYGRECDLDVFNIVAVDDFNMGAMENKGLNVFNARYILARPETATDRDFLGIEGVVAHEYFHNWTGNRITCRDWFQLSLKEGFTVYRDQEFSADMGSRGVKRIEDVRALRAAQFAEDAGPMAHPVRPQSYIEINNFYTLTVYEKGAELVRMQARLLGPDLFRRATDLYFDRHDGQAVTTDAFVACMEDASGRDLSQFRRWYDLAGTPELEVTDAYDGTSGTYRLTVRQQTPDTPGQTAKPPFHIPLALGLLDPSGRDLPLRLSGETRPGDTTRLLELRERQETFTFEGIPERPIPSLLRGFSAPVKVRFAYRDEDLMFLMARDSDPFTRWDAAQTLAQRVLLAMVAARAAGRAMDVPGGFVAAFGVALTDRHADPALLAEVLTLPSETYLGDQMGTVDVDGIHAAHEALRGRIARELHAGLLAVVDACREPPEFRLDPAAIARRRLRNLALYYLVAGEGSDGIELCLGQYRSARNMTDRMAALSLLAAGDSPERESVLADFEARWRDEPLVLDKWFGVQATAPRPDTLGRVQALMGHPTFSLRNPNRIRALIGSFAAGNPLCFHAADGSGYRFLGDRVLEIDPLNPQVASRMLRTLTRWRRYDPGRQAIMKGQLERVLRAPSVSRDTYEIGAKSLD